MLGQVSRVLFHTLAASPRLKHLASRYGMRRPDSFARRFIPGESADEAIDAARRIEASGFTTTLDLLGESVRTMAEAAAATRAYQSVIDRVVASGTSRNLSVKLTQLGLTVDRATAVDNMRRLLDAARVHDFFVRIDMEGSAYTQVTLDVFETVWQQEYRNAGVAIQSYLPRSARDVERLNALGARVRLVKGAYREPKTVAYRDKRQVDAAFVELMQVLLTEGVSPAIATHDPAMIDATTRFASRRGIAADRFEFQMLYGIRRDLQARLLAEGYRVRIYIPFGREWFPYFMRRLGERPANVGFVIRSILQEH
jgi:proline dehydrogenase